MPKYGGTIRYPDGLQVWPQIEREATLSKHSTQHLTMEIKNLSAPPSKIYYECAAYVKILYSILKSCCISFGKGQCQLSYSPLQAISP